MKEDLHERNRKICVERAKKSIVNAMCELKAWSIHKEESKELIEIINDLSMMIKQATPE